MITLSILVGHYVGDFLLQFRSWANNKHKDSVALIKHVSVYTVVITLAMWFGTTVGPYKIPLNLVVLWGIVNGIAHCIIDFITSRLFHKYWPINQGLAIKIFGLDQLCHMMCLLGTLGGLP